MPRHAPHHTRLGQLQRGRGAGFLAALANPAAARPELLRCILTDPRLDQQIESRCRYFAELALQIDLPIEPIVQHATTTDDDFLAIDVLAELAARGHQQALALWREPDRAPQLCAGMVSYLRDHPAVAHAVVPFAAIAQLAELLHERNELQDDVEIYDAFWRPLAARLPSVADAYAAASLQTATEALQEPEPIDDPAAVPTAQLLDFLDAAASWRVADELAHRTTAEDRALLAFRVEHDESRPRLHAAAKALGSMGDPRLLELAEAWFARPDDFRDPQRMLSPTDRQRRTALLFYVAALPGELTLPLARAWWPRGAFFRTAAARVLERHAEAGDRDWLEAATWQLLERDGDLAGELAALQHIGDRRSLPLYVAVADRATHAFARARALAAMLPLAADAAAARALGEAPWDCEAEAREIGCQGAPITAAVTARLRQLAADPLEDEAVGAAAASRLGDATGC